MHDPFAQFGVSRALNAAGTLTRLGGANVAPDVAAAMASAAQASVDIVSLQAAAARRIAQATGAEAGIVTTGASAALTLSAAACMAGLDTARMERLPSTDGIANEIVMARTHRTAYDRALRTAGAVIRDVGVNDRGTGAGIRGIEPWEFESAITEKTVALAISANRATVADIPGIIAVAQRHDLPVIVDAAAQLPPRENLRRFIDDGATLVAFSGGKAIGGPQASGILAGRRDLIASALLQQIDMDVDPDAFVAPPEFFGNGLPKFLPRHGIGRGFKASKEAIVGLLVALDSFADRDEGLFAGTLHRRLDAIAANLNALSGTAVSIQPAGMPRAYPRLQMTFDAACPGGNARELAYRLRQAAIPVYLSEERVNENILILDLINIAPADDALLTQAIRAAIAT